MYKKCEAEMGRTQFGFKSGMGTREALFCTQVLVQNCRDVKKDVFLCFIDYEKAFDRVQHDKLVQILHQMNIDGKDIQCIKNLYWHQRAIIKIGDVDTEQVEINRGVRQGCVLSPMLFNIYSEYIFREALENRNEGIKVNGENINNIRYADDTTLLADSITDLQTLVNRVSYYSKKFGLNINTSKTKFMITSRAKTPYDDARLLVENQSIERVPKFKYLGYWLDENWDTSKEIKTRIEVARSAFTKYKKVLNNRDINLKLRMRFCKCYVWSILLYGMEVWILKVKDMNRLEAFEMWTYRRLLKISWVDRVTNVEVLRQMSKERELLSLIKRRKVAYLGHIMRNEKYEVLQLIVQGKIEERCGVGRK